jgi:hypothetical protein
LGRDWLNDEHINMMMEELTKALDEDKVLKDKVMVAPLGLANELTINGLKGNYKRTPILRWYEKHIKDKAIETLFSSTHKYKPLDCCLRRLYQWQNRLR